MMRATWMFVFGLTACGGTAPESSTPPTPVASTEPARPSRPPPSADKPLAQQTVADIAVGSKDHHTLVAALQAAELVDALASPGGIYTVFAPTDAAFEKLPAGTVEGLLKPEKKTDLQRILKHHAMVPIREDLKDGEQLSMSDGTVVTVHRSGDQLQIDGANVLGSVKGMNGIVYVVDGVLLPPT